MEVRQPIARQDSMQTVIQTSRRLDSFLHEAAENFEVFSNIQEWIRKSKTYSGWCPFQGLSNGTTLMWIQSGRTVPLNVWLFVELKNHSEKPARKLRQSFWLWCNPWCWWCCCRCGIVVANSTARLTEGYPQQPIQVMLYPGHKKTFTVRKKTGRLKNLGYSTG